MRALQELFAVRVNSHIRILEGILLLLSSTVESSDVTQEFTDVTLESADVFLKFSDHTLESTDITLKFTEVTLESIDVILELIICITFLSD